MVSDIFFQKLLLIIIETTFWAKLPHRVFIGGKGNHHLALPQKRPLGMDALTQVAVSEYCHINLYITNPFNFLGVNELDFGAPAQESLQMLMTICSLTF